MPEIRFWERLTLAVHVERCTDMEDLPNRTTDTDDFTAVKDRSDRFGIRDFTAFFSLGADSFRGENRVNGMESLYLKLL